MKHITFAEKSLMVGNVTGDLLLEYAAKLANASAADTVVLNAIGAGGELLEATFLLDGVAPIMAETTNSSQPEPDNTSADDYMRSRLDVLAHRAYPVPQPNDDPAARAVLDDFDV